tara:strand:+ start:123 stop:905 length:783 start_codon:yes stop_codon:yes gene_type:complete
MPARTDYEYFERLGQYDPKIRKRAHTASYVRRYAQLPLLPEGDKIIIDMVVARPIPYKLLTRADPVLFPEGDDPMLDWVADDVPYPFVILALGEAFRVHSDFWYFLENEMKSQLPGQVRLLIDKTRRKKNGDTFTPNEQKLCKSYEPHLAERLFTAAWPRKLVSTTRGDMTDVLPDPSSEEIDVIAHTMDGHQFHYKCSRCGKDHYHGNGLDPYTNRVEHRVRHCGGGDDIRILIGRTTRRKFCKRFKFLERRVRAQRRK